jgi:hypothetical protein
MGSFLRRNHFPSHSGWLLCRYHGLFDPGVLAGKTQLQHLELKTCCLPDAEWLEQLLSHLQPLQQLTYLGLKDTLWDNEQDNPTAAAYAGLTASSKPQHLDLAGCRLPAGVWQHMFPADRQLPQLLSLQVKGVKQPAGGAATAPEGSLLASCCPGLQELGMEGLQVGLGWLAPLQGLTGLHTLRLGCDSDGGGNNDSGSDSDSDDGGDHATAAEGMAEVCQLTGLRELSLRVPHDAHLPQLSLQLTQLQCLTYLSYQGLVDIGQGCYYLSCEVRLSL